MSYSLNQLCTCYISTYYFCVCLFVGDFSDDLLNAHESELDRMRGFHGDNQDVFKLVEKRENLWGRYEDFEVCS